jgi:hypothetical protein
MKKVFCLITMLFFSFTSAFAQRATTQESISNASQFRLRGPVDIKAQNGSRVIEVTRLVRADNDKIQQEVAGMGYRMMNEASIAKDGTIFALASKGQGSQTQLFLILFVMDKKVGLPVTEVTPNKIVFQGGTLEMQAPAK